MPSSSSYAAALANVPRCFVGTIGTLNALVCLLTSTLHHESSALGIELPPWRSKQALLSKWLPRRFADAVFTPPSFTPLHPALKSTVHGTLSTSPISIQSWSSVRRRDSRLSCSTGDDSDACSASTVSQSAFRRQPQEPHTVVRGFTAPAPCSHPPRPASAAAAAFSLAACLPTSTPTRAASCSALTQQLAAASAASRSVQLAAQGHWQHCLFASAAAAGCESRHAQERRPQQHPPQPCATAQQQADAVASSSGLGAQPGSLSIGVSEASLSLRSKSRAVLDSLVVSPVSRGRRSCGAGSWRRGSSNGLKLGCETLKMMPRIYTIKLAAATAC